MRPQFLARAAALAVALVSAPAFAGSVSIAVTGADGRPLAGAVVSIDVPGEPRPALHGPYQIAQHNIAFDPHILIVPVGATVLFPNKDQVRHHVYSFSPAKKFEIKLYGRDETKSEEFDKPGAVALGCNIHDVMSGVVYVTATPFSAITDAAGQVTFASMPAANAILRIWNPAIRAPDNTLVRPIRISPGGLQLTLSAR